MASIIHGKGVEKALDLLRYLPQVCRHNVREKIKFGKRKRGDHGGGTHGHGNKGAKQRCSYTKLGFEGRDTPFYQKVPGSFYYLGHGLRRQYPPVTLKQLQLWIDTRRIDSSEPIDLNTICNTKQYFFDPMDHHFGVHLTDEGADCFTAKINIEVQHAKETVIAAIERNGGVVLNAYYDIDSLMALKDPQLYFQQGKIIPHRKLPPEDAAEFYTDPACRGYLADPDKIAEERFALAQKFGYKFIDIKNDLMFEMLNMRKDPRQVFFGLEPGWAININDKMILRPKDKEFQEYYQS